MSSTSTNDNYQVSLEYPFPKRLKEARTRVGISQRKLGIRAGIDESVAGTRMNQYEQSVHRPPYELVSKFAAILEVPTPYFYCVDDEQAQLLTLFGKSESDAKRAVMELLQKSSGKPKIPRLRL